MPRSRASRAAARRSSPRGRRGRCRGCRDGRGFVARAFGAPFAAPVRSSRPAAPRRRRGTSLRRRGLRGQAPSLRAPLRRRVPSRRAPSPPSGPSPPSARRRRLRGGRSLRRFRGQAYGAVRGRRDRSLRRHGALRGDGFSTRTAPRSRPSSRFAAGFRPRRPAEGRLLRGRRSFAARALSTLRELLLELRRLLARRLVGLRGDAVSPSRPHPSPRRTPSRPPSPACSFAIIHP